LASQEELYSTNVGT